LSNTRLVWSDDPRDKIKCLKCGKLRNECKCIKEVDPNTNKWIARVRIETGGRGGKTVTVIDTLPVNDAFLKDLCKELKNKCGTGGTYKIGEHGVVELQGDKRPQVKAFFEKKGYKFKGL
jgi:translation initiation factor 1